MGQIRSQQVQLIRDSGSALGRTSKQFQLNIFVYFWTMNEELNILKGIHPGFVLESKLKERNIAKCSLALDLKEYPQTLSAITKGKYSWV